MSRRAILALSAALTAFVLIFAGAAASVSLRSASAPAVKPAEGVPVDIVRAREAEYRRLIDEANARLRAQQQQVAVARAQSPEPARVSARVVEDDDEDESHERHGRRHAHHEDDDG